MQLHHFVRAAAFIAAFGASGQAQVGDFTIERVLTLSSALSPNVPNLPPPVLAGLQSGALEIHQVFVYKSAARTLEQNAFVVPGGSPLPFPSPAAAPTADHYIIRVDTAVTTPQPGASAVLTGKVTLNDIPTPFGDITGAIVTLSFGYQGTGDGVRFGPIYESVSPLYGLYTPTGVGSFSPNAVAQKCSTATLNGVYMFHLSGSIQIQTAPLFYGPFADDGILTADGKGNITVHDSGNFAGNSFQNRTFPIAYVINDNCTGTFKWPGAGMDVQVSKDGSTVNMLFTAPSSIVGNGTGILQ